MNNAIARGIACFLTILLLFGCMSAVAEGKTWILSPEETTAEYEMTCFDAQMPDELAAAMSMTRWADWQCQKGIRQIERRKGEAGMKSGAALAVIQKDGQTMLLHFYNWEGKGWNCLPAAEEKALLSGRDFVFDAILERMYPTVQIKYPLADGTSEVFDLSLSRNAEKPTVVMGYRREEKDGGVWINGGGIHGDDFFRLEGLTSDGERTLLEKVPYYYPHWLEGLDADHYPKSLEEARSFAAANPQPFVKEYAILANTNMRERASSQSKLLGAYHAGTLAKILGTEPGKTDPWYKVQVGQTVGYISEPYLHAADEESSGFWYFSTPIPIGKTKGVCTLLSTPASRSEEETTLAANTELYVLADCDGWLHVCIPKGNLGYWMDVEGTFGYLRMEDVIQAVTPLRLKYMVK